MDRGSGGQAFISGNWLIDICFMMNLITERKSIDEGSISNDTGS